MVQNGQKWKRSVFGQFVFSKMAAQRTNLVEIWKKTLFAKNGPKWPKMKKKVFSDNFFFQNGRPEAQFGRKFGKNFFLLKWSKMAKKWEKNVFFSQFLFQNGRPEMKLEGVWSVIYEQEVTGNQTGSGLKCHFQTGSDWKSNWKWSKVSFLNRKWLEFKLVAV